jgi:hypothetical protein
MASGAKERWQIKRWERFGLLASVIWVIVAGLFRFSLAQAFTFPSSFAAFCGSGTHGNLCHTAG